jgi:hypothetical protein
MTSFEMGGTSLLTQRLANQLRKVLTSMSRHNYLSISYNSKLCEFVENTKAAIPLVSHSNIKKKLNGILP